MKRREFLASSVAGVGLGALGHAGVSQAATLPTWVSNLPLWQWYAIPNTALSSVAPSTRPSGNTGPSSKIDTWNGAALKRAGSVYMLGAAGGHNDYGGNEVNALVLNTATPQWSQLRAPTANSLILGNGTAYQFYADGRPSSTHTYYATQFIDSTNRMVVLASPGYTGPASGVVPSGWGIYTGSAYSFVFNASSNDWESPGVMAAYPGGGDFTAALCVKHQLTNEIYYSRSYSGAGWWRYSPSTNAWTQLSAKRRDPWYAGAAIDPNRNRIMHYGGYNGEGPGVLDLNGSTISASFSGRGSDLATAGYPGLLFDEANDAFIAVYNGGGGTLQVRRINAATWAVDAPAMTGAAPGNRPNGIQNAAQYVPELGGFVIANNYNGNVYFVRTSSSGQNVPAPDTTPPAAPQGLRAS